MNIKILGTGCPKCKTLEVLTKEVISENNFEADVSKVEDIVQIMNYGVMSTPGIVINEKVALSGRVPSKDEIKKLIEKHING
ncbi:MAG: redox-active disulfide protein 2 [Bacteroidetes bacterium RIFOXYA12_FULL_35_11]|nr:MAG: redox-active disulfide protein 2 [Bacteroidetes bacterium GWF2_35_48]OFY73635.1 MAG: redox-active disulfide protein 2 [Bacteroidetes bacterium RIFOXYA12_FULL_35_11]OFY94265.1 MAG: redox-active disulfide protein 2 [Bacteroidetes bacterium RIFOXYC12_FULL_35_7]OFY94617.1 MAG: redox-active disulfide protein 2 [Bacteroidetes bacterium RIFOXYB2_FULL_35_7]HBX52402.1 redox-active disulfide protein 2 [Bacteroidales bacterium]